MHTNQSTFTLASIRLPLLGGLLPFFPVIATAHERWVLTPEQIAHLNALPKPALYTGLSFTNVAMITMFLLFILGWIRLGFTGARELFPDLQARLASYGDHVPRILRVCLAWMLISSAFGLEPRTGVEMLSSPTLFAPDLELKLLDSGWGWLRWFEVLLGLAILFGIYVRFCAILLMLLGLLAGWLFGLGFLAYGGAILGSCLYLLLQGPGRHYLPLPVPASLVGVVAWLDAQPRCRAQAIMRVLTGFTMLYLGVTFKIMQPNLAVGIIEMYRVPLLSAAPEGFSLFMALVEVSAGLLMIAGILLRPLSLFLLAAFAFFASLLPETLTEHILFYGVMLSCFINSAGHWRKPEPSDQAADILVIGGGAAALSAAMKIEKLVGAYSRVRISLLHENSNFLFTPLLPEVVGGTVQPGNVVNPIRRIIPQVNVVIGRLESIDSDNRVVRVRRPNGERVQMGYTELIVAQTAIPDTARLPGLLAHATPIDSVGDALHIRKRVLDLVEEAEFTGDAEERVRLLNIAVIGSGEIACSVAAELCQMLKSMEHSYPVLRESGWWVRFYENPDLTHSTFEQERRPLRDACLARAGVSVEAEPAIASVGVKELSLANGTRQPVGLIINACFDFPALRILGTGGLTWPFSIRSDMALDGFAHIWIAEPQRETGEQHFITAADWRLFGEAAGYNAWAATQGFKTRQHRPRERIIRPFSIGFQSFCDIRAFSFSGRLAWLLSRLTNLLVMPGLEKGLRILIDWALIIPFRSDISVLSAAPTARLQKVQHEGGSEIFHQGEEAEMAYIVESGRLEIIRDEQKAGELGPGDYFGEIVHAYLNRRAETVRCITDCELTVLSQADFKSLTKGTGMMNKALQHLTRDHGGLATEAGLKRIMYVSTMHTSFTEEEIIELGRTSSLNNNRLGLTGVLISVHEYFFQILEGQPSVVDSLLDKIRADGRHRDLTVLSAEYGLSERLFTDWGMRTVCLNEDSGVLLQAIRIMLRNIAQSHHIIGRYTQPAVLKLLTEGVNPLMQPVRRTEKVVLFGCLNGFANISGLPVEEVTAVLNSFFELCSSCVVEHGGQVAKYVDETFVAYFPAGQADAAIWACMDTLRGFRELRDTDNPLFQGLSCGLGLTSGPVIEGNIGSSVKMDYTILEGAAREAARMISLGQGIEKSLLLSAAVREASQSPWPFEALTPLGEGGNQVVYSMDEGLMSLWATA